MGVEEAIRFFDKWRCSGVRIHCVLLPSPEGGAWSLNALCVVHSVSSQALVLAFSSDASLTLSMQECRFSSPKKPEDSVLGKALGHRAKYECSIGVSFSKGESLILAEMKQSQDGSVR